MKKVKGEGGGEGEVGEELKKSLLLMREMVEMRVENGDRGGAL